MTILSTKPASLRRAAFLLACGHVVAVPTETVYGLAANAWDTAAVGNVFAIKGRPLVDPLIVHVLNLSSLHRVAHPVEGLKLLARAFWPGPLTIVLPKRTSLPDLVTAGRDTVAVRMPAHPALRRILARCNCPLAAPSANPFGYISPTRAAHVQASLKDRVQTIVDGGPCQTGLESTILDLTAEVPTLLRPGPISKAQLEQQLGIPVKIRQSAVREDMRKSLSAPGQFIRHYSPHRRLHLFSGALPTRAMRGTVVWLQRPTQPRQGHYWLSDRGELEDTARNLFHLLRQLDSPAHKAEPLWLELPTGEGGLAPALRDRMTRAASRE